MPPLVHIRNDDGDVTALFPCDEAFLLKNTSINDMERFYIPVNNFDFHHPLKEEVHNYLISEIERSGCLKDINLGLECNYYNGLTYATVSACKVLFLTKWTDFESFWTSQLIHLRNGLVKHFCQTATGQNVNPEKYLLCVNHQT